MAKKHHTSKKSVTVFGTKINREHYPLVGFSVALMLFAVYLVMSQMGSY